jgi:hypothetical protein
MSKIPVGRVIGRTYAFTFGEIGTVIGLIWIPTLLTVVGSFLVQRMMAGQPMPDPAGPPAMPAGASLSFLFLILSQFFSVMVAVALTRQTLGLRQGPAFAHFAIGAEELRVFGSFMLMYLLVFLFALAAGIIVAVLLGVIAAAIPDKAVSEAAGAAVALVGGLAGLGALVYLMARLSFLMIPSAVNEGEFGLTRSWELTKGNFWRIIGVALGTALPALVLIIVAEVIILGPDYFLLMGQMIKDYEHGPKYAAQIQDIAQHKTPVLLGFALLAAPITNSLIFTPAAFAYQMVSGKVIVASKSVE